jgi:MinD-like ATPase involved in chromosome partitioning or flagellar assembly
MAETGARVLLGAVDPAHRDEIAARCAAHPSLLADLELPAGPEDDGAGRISLCAAIEEAGRAADRIVLDLGPTTSEAAAFFGAAVDDLVLLVDAAVGAARRSAAYVARLRRRWDREDVLLVVSGTPNPTGAAAAQREIASATTAAAPRLVPLGVVPSLPDVAHGALVVLDEPDGAPARAIAAIAARLLAPRPVPVRGGVQFFLEDRIGQRRAG